MKNPFLFLIISGVVILLGLGAFLLIHFGVFNSFVQNVQIYEQNMNVQETLVSSNPNSYIFTQSFSTNMGGATNLQTSVPFEISVAGRLGNCQGTISNFPSDIQSGSFTTTNVNLNPAVGGASNNNYLVLDSNYYQIKDQKAVCNIERNIGCGYGSDLYCVLSATIVPKNGQQYVSFGVGSNSDVSGSLTIEILKNGVQCTSTQLSQCSSGQICVNNQCSNPAPTQNQTQQNNQTNQNPVPVSGANPQPTFWQSIINFFVNFWNGLFGK